MRTVQNPEERRAEILAGATELFLTSGFDQTTVDDIVAQLGISKGLVYYYFRTKDDLIAAVTERLAAEFADPVVAILQSDLSAGEKLARSLLNLADRAVAFKERFRSMIDSRQSQAISRFRDEVFHRIAPQLISLTRDGIAGGLIANPGAAQSLTVIVVGSITCLTLGPEMLGFDRQGFLASVADTLERSLQMQQGTITGWLERAPNGGAPGGEDKGA